MPNQKIKGIEELASLLSYRRSLGQRVVLACGCFDLLHADHLHHLEEACSAGEVLAVLVTPDRFVKKGPRRPAFSQALRAEMLAALSCVDFVSVNEWPTAVEAITALRPHVYVKGGQATADGNPALSAEEAAVAAVGGRMLFTDTHEWSSSALVDRQFFGVPDAGREWLAAFPHTAVAVNEWLDKAKSLKVLVAGEAITDEYVWVDALGKSGKEPILVVREIEREKHDGGAIVVANHVRQFAVDVTQYSAGERLTKTRFVSRYPQQKIGLEVYSQTPGSVPWRPPTVGMEYLDKYDIVMVADYGHGMFETPKMTMPKFVAVNVQNNAGNYGYNTHHKYGRIDYLCLSESELRLAARQRNSDLRELVTAAAERHECRMMTVTRGDKGVLCWSKDSGFVDCPAFSDHFTDRVGAGDAVLAVTSLLAALGAPIDVVAFVANAVGSLAVKIIGNRESVQKAALQKHIVSLLS